MPINGKVKQLYDALKYDGADVGTEQEFNDYFFAKGEQGYKNRKAVYDAFKSDGADVGENYEEFASWLELQPKTHKVPKPQNTPKQNESWWNGDPSFRQDQQQYTQKVYNPAEDNMGVGVGAAIAQPQPKRLPHTYIPQDFGQLDTTQAQRMGAGLGPVSWEEPSTLPDHQETAVEKQARMLRGDATKKEQKQIQNRMQQRADEIAYEQETGKRLRQPVLDTTFEAPTVARDENGEILIGNTTDQDRVNAHHQTMASQAEWDALSDSEKRERMKQMQLEMEKNEYEEPGFLGVTGKKLGSGFIKAGLGLLNGMKALTSGMIVEDASSPTGYSRTGKYDPINGSDAINRGLEAANKYAERMSREGEPRKGAGFTDLLLDGDLGGFLLKGWGSALESAPMTLSIYNPYTMALNAISMAGNNFRENTIENPDIPAWKRASMAVGSAAIEQIVEKFSDPVFKHFGGGKIVSWFGKKASEETTKKIAKEAESVIARRIMSVLKDAGAEGLEEVATNFGNDALGQALDWLDGESDYGIVAQWIDLKKKNPNASLQDFALQKATENLDSLFGGALGGAYMSGTAQATAAGMQYATGNTVSAEQIESMPNTPLHPATLDIAQSFDEGYSLTNDEEKNQVADRYDEYRKRMIDSVGEDVLNRIDANPTEALGNIDQYGLDEEGQQMLGEYLSSKAAFDGILQRITEEQKRSRVNSYNIRGNVVEEVDVDGNILATHEYENEEEMHIGLWALQAERANNDMQADISMAKLNPKYDWNSLVSGFAGEMGMTPEEVEDLLNADYMTRSEESDQVVSEFAKMLHGVLYDNTTVHEVQSAEDGADVAENMAINLNDLSPDQTEQATQLIDEVSASKRALDEAFAKNEDLMQEVQRMEQQGMPHQGIISSLETFRPEEVQAVIDYYNAQAKYQGFLNRMAQKIDEEAANSRQRHTMKGTIDGKADLNNVYTITDGVNHYYLVSGDITTDPATGRITGSTQVLLSVWTWMAALST